MVSAAHISTQSVYYVYPTGIPSFLPQIRPRQTHMHLMGLTLAAVRLQPSNIAPGLTTTHTHKVSAENVPFVGIDESTVSAPLAGISFQANTQADDAAQITTENCRACLWSVCRRKITAFFCAKQNHFLVVTRASVSDRLKKTLPEKAAVSIPKSAASGIGFQIGQNRYHFLSPFFCRFWYQFSPQEKEK